MGANEHCDEVALALLSAELPDESEVVLSEWATSTTRKGSGSRCRFCFLGAVFGNSQTSGSSRSVMATCNFVPNLGG
jgi:hypothetical protein